MCGEKEMEGYEMNMNVDQKMIVLKCSPEDSKDVYFCRFDPVSIHNSFTHDIPTFEQHHAYYLNAIKTMIYYKGVVDGKCIGFVRFNKTDKGTEVSICIHPSYRGKKLASLLLVRAIELHGNPGDLYAEIKIGNVASFKAFARVAEKLAQGKSFNMLERLGWNVE